jgi:hypothetical protein
MSEIKRNVYQRINAIREKVDYIKKDAKVEGYQVVTHDAVTSAVRQHLIDYGIVIVPRLISSVMKETGTTTAKGVPWMRYEGWYEIDFVNIDTPEDMFTMPIEAHALDYGDKAPGKSCSYATKYALLKVFNIETGESEESRADQKPDRFRKGEKEELYASVMECLDNGDELGLKQIFEEYEDADQKIKVWGIFNSTERAAIKELLK